VLDALAREGFAVRRYGAQATVEDHAGTGCVPAGSLVWQFSERQRMYSDLLCELGAPDGAKGLIREETKP
jgi:hypothetical protein